MTRAKTSRQDENLGQPLALTGGSKALPEDFDWDDLKWPIVTEEDEQAVLEVLRAGKMSGTDITRELEAELAEWLGVKHALGYCNGTASILAAMWACGVGAGDEIICPSMTYWASAAPALQLGATVNFADIGRDSLCIDPDDIEHRIGPRTKAIVAVHYSGYPCDMDPIMAIARKHNLRVIEDVSHALGALYKGRMVGTIGDIAGISMMTGKSFAVGEAGAMVTNNTDLYERCIAFGHYERTGVASNYNPAAGRLADAGLDRFAGVPIGGVKHRMNQMCSAMGRVQLKYYPQRIKEIQKAMNHFWDLLDGVPGVIPHRPGTESGSTMGGWYRPKGLYRSEQLTGLPCEKFCQAVQAEGVPACTPGANDPLHLHPVFTEADIFNQGKPTAIAFGQRDVRQGAGSLPVAESIREIAFSIPWFKHDRIEMITQVVEAFRKVAAQADKLL